MEPLNLSKAQVITMVHYVFEQLDDARQKQNIEKSHNPGRIICHLGLLEFAKEHISATTDMILIAPDKDVDIANKNKFGYCLDTCPGCGNKRLVAVNPIANTHIYLKCKFCP